MAMKNSFLGAYSGKKFANSDSKTSCYNLLNISGYMSFSRKLSGNSGAQMFTTFYKREKWMVKAFSIQINLTHKIMGTNPVHHTPSPIMPRCFSEYSLLQTSELLRCTLPMKPHGMDFLVSHIGKWQKN
jgi:hypothetical protein